MARLYPATRRLVSSWHDPAERCETQTARLVGVCSGCKREFLPTVARVSTEVFHERPVSRLVRRQAAGAPTVFRIGSGRCYVNGAVLSAIGGHVPRPLPAHRQRRVLVHDADPTYPVNWWLIRRGIKDIM
jgi:hypothetical protein